MPSSMFAKTTQPQEGEKRIRIGTGRANTQPVTRLYLRPHCSPTRPANRFAIALMSPKLTMKERMAARDASPNSRSASNGRITRSIPTVAPTKAFTATRSVNCSQLAPRPKRTEPELAGTSAPALGDGTAIRSRLQIRGIALGQHARFVQLDDS